MTQPATPQITPGTFTTPAPQAGAGAPGASVVPGQGNSPASNPINHYGALSMSGEVNGNAGFGVPNSPMKTAQLSHGATAVRQSVVKQALNAVMRPWSLQGEDAWPDERHKQTKRVDSVIPPNYGPDKHNGLLKKATARRPSQGLARTKTATGMIMPPQPAAAHGGQLGGDPTAQPQAALQAMTQPAMPQITPGTFTTPAPQAGAGAPGASVVPGQGNSPASNPINHYGALSCSGEVTAT